MFHVLVGSIAVSLEMHRNIQYVHTSKVGKFDFLKNCKAKWGEKKMPNVLLIRKMSNFLFQKSMINTFCKFVVDFILA